MSSAATPTARPRLRSVALPTEHGSWGLALEPVALGLLVAPTLAGLCLALSALMAFVAHRPLRLAWSDHRSGRRYPRTALAERVLFVYALVSAIGLLGAVRLAGLQPLVPLAFALPLLAAFAAYAARNDARSWQAELAAPTGFAAIAPAIAVAGGWALPDAMLLWGAMVARSVPSVLYVRARLRLERGERAQVTLALGAHVLALAGVFALVWFGRLPVALLLPYVILFARAAIGLSPRRRKVSTRAIGFMETGLGILTVVLVALAFRSV